MARKIDSYRARTPKKYAAPKVPKRSELRDNFAPLTPKVPLPDTDLEEFQQRYQQWRGRYPAGSVPEFIVYEYLTKRKKWRDGLEFKYQYGLLGGRTKYGGLVIDFFITPPYNMAWNVQGLRYHLQDPADRAKVILQNAEMEKRGYITINLWEDDLIERPTFTIEAALRGESTKRHTDDVGIMR